MPSYLQVHAQADETDLRDHKYNGYVYRAIYLVFLQPHEFNQRSARPSQVGVSYLLANRSTIQYVRGHQRTFHDHDVSGDQSKHQVAS